MSVMDRPALEEKDVSTHSVATNVWLNVAALTKAKAMTVS